MILSDMIRLKLECEKNAAENLRQPDTFTRFSDCAFLVGK